MAKPKLSSPSKFKADKKAEKIPGPKKAVGALGSKRLAPMNLSKLGKK